MVLVDSSVWIDVFRDATTRKRSTLEKLIGERTPVLTRFHQIEMLQGAADEDEWDLLAQYLDHQDYLEMTEGSWREAARMYFELRRRGKTVRSSIDCCIAQLALENGIELLHRDRDFAAIAKIRPLRQVYVSW
ncbi:MAG TPA: PIN domain-containing protein [Thermoanaerobaculia bacterium]|nr:PIN domain-containing protein [Thermoanaerobaculia bacterium]